MNNAMRKTHPSLHGVVDTRDNSACVATQVAQHFHDRLPRRRHEDCQSASIETTTPCWLAPLPHVSFISPLSVHSRRVRVQKARVCPQRTQHPEHPHPRRTRYRRISIASTGEGPTHAPPGSGLDTTTTTVSAIAAPHTGSSSSSSSAKGSRNPVVILPGLGNAAADYRPLATKLLERGHQSVTVVSIQRWQWALNARGFFTRDYWAGTLTPSPTLDWYFKRVNEAVGPLVESDPQQPISFLGHSAGGWLARLYLAMHAPAALRVASMVTLGTPHMPPPQGAPDQTRGLLKYVADQCADLPTTISSPAAVVCVAGTGVKGAALGKGSVQQLVAYVSYAAVCGNGIVDGDGVTPMCAATMPGAQLVVCAGCGHSMLTDTGGWYGGDDALPSWEQYLT